jgi:DNA ligase-1
MIATEYKLFSRDTKGKVRVWWMDQQRERYRTNSGLQDGEIVTSEWTVAEAKNAGKKNETSSISQATKEVEAKYKKQLKSGYFKSIKDIDRKTFVEPMLAKQYKDYKEDIDFSKGQWVLQVKLNGNRCIATKDGLFTRTGETYTSVPHISKSLESFFNSNPDAILDGELYNYDLRQQLNELSKLVRKTVHLTPEDFAQSKKLIQYYIYDGYGFNGMDESVSYDKRKKWIDDNLSKCNECIKVLKYQSIFNKDSFNKFYQTYINDGEEGGILRNTLGGYEHKRSKNLLKIKPEDDAEFKIIDIQEGNGNWAGKAKIISVKMSNGEVFDATFKGSMEDAAICLKEKSKWIGKTVTINYFGLTGLGTPNYAQFNYRNCIKGDR